MANAKVLWRIECQDCPTTRNEEWGYDEKVGLESPDKKRVQAWAWNHVCKSDSPTRGHIVEIFEVVRFSINVININQVIMRKLIGQ